MLKFLRFAASVFLVALIVGCSPAEKLQVKSPAQPDPAIVDKAERLKALVEDLEAIELKLNAANDAALKNYQDTHIRITEELVARYHTDRYAELTADSRHAENERAYLEKQLQNGEEAKQGYRQVLNKPEHQQTLQDMGLSPEIVLNEPIENILIRVQAKARTQKGGDHQ